MSELSCTPLKRFAFLLSKEICSIYIRKIPFCFFFVNLDSQECSWYGAATKLVGKLSRIHSKDLIFWLLVGPAFVLVLIRLVSDA